MSGGVGGSPPRGVKGDFQRLGSGSFDAPPLTAKEVLIGAYRDLDEARRGGGDFAGNVVAAERALRLAWDYFERRTGGERKVTMDELLQKAQHKLEKELGAAIAALEAHKAEREKLPPQYYRDELARLTREVRLVDAAALEAVTAYQIEAMGEARRLRSAAEASIDPAVRVAEITERRALAESGLDAEVLVERARVMLDDGQPQRAALMLGAARDRGGRLPILAGTVHVQIERALDASDPQRKAALGIEQSIGSNLARLRQTRLAALRDGGLGITRDGDAGTGASGQVAVASATAKLAAWIDQHGGEIDASGGEA